MWLLGIRLVYGKRIITNLFLKENTMLKDFRATTLALLIKEQIGDFEVDTSGLNGLNELFPVIYESVPVLRYFRRRVNVAKVHTESGYVTMIDGNPAYESLIGRLATLLVAEFKTINRVSGEPGSIVTRLQVPVC